MSPREELDPQAARNLETAELVSRCAGDRGDAVAWSEFLNRMSPSIRSFVRVTVKQERINPAHEHDLQQNVVLKLVANDCAVLRRFTGSSEDELRVYLAVIARSVVRDFGRQQRAAKRPQEYAGVLLFEELAGTSLLASEAAQERQVLSRELIDLGRKIIQQASREVSDRDYLIFVLYYVNGLTTPEIARCRAVGLSQRAVVDVIRRLTDRVRLAAEASSAEGIGR